jgi:PilZ domain
LPETPPLCRKEPRIPVKTFVNLYNLGQPAFELAPTIDISCHGARVVTKNAWQPNQPISVRSIRGNLYSHARVVYCQPYTENSFVIGIEMYYPTGDWTKPSR